MSKQQDRSILRVSCLTLAFVMVGAAAARAEGAPRPEAPMSSAIAKAAREAAFTIPAWAVDRAERRPAVLPALYGTYAALQGLDIYSTRRALSAGATEANPLLRSGGTARALAIKGAAGAATIFFAERAWKKNRAGAIVLMAALNGATAAIVARNAHNVRR
jgi:hypothetical protein